MSHVCYVLPRAMMAARGLNYGVIPYRSANTVGDRLRYGALR